jgi:hypothetical protein
VKHFTVLLASLALGFGSQAMAQKWQIQPGAIQKQSDAYARLHRIREPITGSFTLRNDPNGNESKRGGACLVFQPTRYPRTCSSNADCMPKSLSAGGSGSSLVPVEWHGYCVASFLPNPIGGTLAKQCWYRPGGDSAYCNKSNVDRVENQANSLPIVGALSFQPRFPFGPDHSVRWRVISCQNLVEQKCGDPNAREGIDKRTQYGTPKAFGP